LDSKRAAFLATCQKLGIEAHVTERRATENYFPQRAIAAAFRQNYTELKPFEKLSCSATPWPKNENWRIARNMELRDMEGTDLGSFLQLLKEAHS
jgi:hypothetical protein